MFERMDWNQLTDLFVKNILSFLYFLGCGHYSILHKNGNTNFNIVTNYEFPLYNFSIDINIKN